MHHETPRTQPLRSPLQRACRAFCTSAALLAATTAVIAQDVKISDDIVRLGILTDLSGPFADITGPGSAAAIHPCWNAR